MPLVGAIVAGLFGPWIKERGAQIVTCGAMLLSALAGLVIFNDVALNHQPVTVPLFTWMVSGGFEVDWALRFDTLTAVMIVVVTVVSCALWPISACSPSSC